MAFTYVLAPNPKWYIADLTGLPLAAGTMKTYSNLNKTVFKYVYRDAGGNQAWTDPVLFDENGSQGPFYWAVNDSDADDTYYIEVYDVDGVLQWTIENFSPPASGGGGGNVTTAIDLKNYITNNVMLRNFGASPSPIVLTEFKIASGAHAGLAQTAANYGPDIWFVKNNTSATDQLSFVDFTPIGTAFLTADTTPVQYVKYACTGAGTGETKKCVQFPITKSVQNLSNSAMTATIWARCNSGNTQLSLYWAQFFGDGTATPGSATARTLIQTLTLTSSWVKYTVTANVPSVSGKTLGDCGNDGLFFQVEYPYDALTNIDFAKPCVFLGSVIPTITYDANDTIEAVINSPRTGYIFPSYDLVAPFGYLLMDDGTIGSASSGATNRANTDTFPLYNWLWNNVTSPSGNTLCVVSGGALGASAAADFSANRTLTLQAMMGRALSSAGAGSGLTSRALGSITGSETHTLIEAELASHTHGWTWNGAPTSAALLSDQASGGVPPQLGTGAGGPNKAVEIANTGSGTPFSIMQPASFVKFFIKL